MNQFEQAKAAKSNETKTVPLKAFEERMVRHFEKQSIALVRVKDSSDLVAYLGRYYGLNYRPSVKVVFSKWYEKDLIKCARENGRLKPNEVVDGCKW
jgi:hypothetical protein